MRYETTTLEQALKEVKWITLVIHETSGMSQIITGEDARLKHSKVDVMIAYDNDIPVAWGWSYTYNYNLEVRRRGFQFFVQPDYRRQGIGSQLFAWGLEEAQKRHLKLKVYPWDDKGQCFFDKHKVSDKNRGWW
tara:strand:+ start:1490 stop:1891 length:402 start_codon:yes stop_codon:yes gene_type:complete